jgi:maltose alpha-D-glucosyltransferase/alpha-amylase
LCTKEGTSNENLPETHQVIKQWRTYLDANFTDKIFLAEANQWPEDVAKYFGNDDECHMAYNFPLMPRLYIALKKETRKPIVDIMENLPHIPEHCQWALFLRNHDELTLEMVTDEERDYMYKEYAKDPKMRRNVGIIRRLAPLMDNSQPLIRLLNSILLSFPGTPIIYYGDEIGMGDNIYLGDRNGVRTPMQWTPDKNAGFSHASPHQLYLPPIMDTIYGYQAINVETESLQPNSLLNYMKRLIHIRQQYPVFGRGTITFLKPKNHKILAYIRACEQQTVLCIVNLSKAAEFVELDLSSFAFSEIIEIFGHNIYHTANSKKYSFTMHPHAFFWFELLPLVV